MDQREGGEVTLPSRMFRDPLQVLIDKENASKTTERMQRMQSFIMGRERREDYRQLRSRVESGAQGPLSEIQGTAIVSEESVHFLF